MSARSSRSISGNPSFQNPKVENSWNEAGQVTSAWHGEARQGNCIDFINALDFCNTCMRKSGSKPSLPIGGNTWSTIPSCSVYLDKHVISVDNQLRYFGFKGFSLSGCHCWNFWLVLGRQIQAVGYFLTWSFLVPVTKYELCSFMFQSKTLTIWLG